MNTRFAHVNIVSKDWRKLADFYIKVFECTEKPPERHLTGKWLNKLTNLNEAKIRGIHLRLPGYDTDGPTLEIFEYGQNLSNESKEINLEGFGHIAFSVKDVEEKLNLLLQNGGSTVGELVNTVVEGVGAISVVYAKDPEGNIVEIQKWE
jgi:predicted enzyme related to lactoylglutathione lyase